MIPSRPEPGQTWIKTYPDGTTQRRWVRSVHSQTHRPGGYVIWHVMFSGDECGENEFITATSMEWRKWSCEAELQPG